MKNILDGTPRGVNMLEEKISEFEGIDIQIGIERKRSKK